MLCLFHRVPPTRTRLGGILLGLLALPTLACGFRLPSLPTLACGFRLPSLPTLVLLAFSALLLSASPLGLFAPLALPTPACGLRLLSFPTLTLFAFRPLLLPA